MISSSAEIIVTRKFPYVMSMLEKVQSQPEYLSKSECKATEVILASSDNVIHSSTVALTLEASVSEPTVNHFYRGMDTCGPPDFKLHLTRSLAGDISYVNRNVNKDDSVESYTGKIFESTMATLDYVHHLLGKSAIDRIVDLLTQVKKITFFGLGPSAAIAHDAINKFPRSNVPVVCSDDIVLRRMSCVNYSSGDVVVLISHTGRTKNLIELARLTRGGDATMIALTSVDTPLARGATLATTLDVLEDADIYMLMVFRLAQLVVINVLATGSTLRRDVEFRDSLKRVKEVLEESCFDKQLLNLSDSR